VAEKNLTKIGLDKRVTDKIIRLSASAAKGIVENFNRIQSRGGTVDDVEQVMDKVLLFFED
jgi:hypothetical protein